MDNKGSTLIENIISIFLLTIFAAMATTCILSGMKAVSNAALENQRLYRIYTLIENEEYTDPDLGKKENSRFSFEIDGTEYSIGGTVYHDEEKNILGEFIQD